MTDPHAPLRLADAADLAYPHGGMTVSGLRREARRGRLVIERVAGKDYTTLAAIAEMRRLCQLNAKAPTFGSGSNSDTPMEACARPSGTSATANSAAALDALDTTLQALSGRSNPTSPPSEQPKRRKGANVIRAKFS